MSLKITSTSEWKYPDNWPPYQYFSSYMDVSKAQADELESLIESSVNETKIDNFLRSNPNLLVNCLKSLNTGHHGAWVIPQQKIRPSMKGHHKGLIPDYILGGKNSDGFSWFVLELKGIDHKMFTIKQNLIYLSSVLNKAVCQTMEYIDYCSSNQVYLRDTFKLNDFREPCGLILIGRESEVQSNERSKALKSAWNRYLGSKIEIRSYDSLLRSARNCLPTIAVGCKNYTNGKSIKK